MKIWIKFNLNDFVKVKLTDKGKEVYGKYYDCKISDMLKSHYEGDGYYRFQLHELASVFGEGLRFGSSSLPFETEIYFYVEEK